MFGLGAVDLGIVHCCLHAGDVFAIELRNAPHIFAQGFERG